MYQAEHITKALLDIERVGSVFELFFVFLRDDGSNELGEQTFESAMQDIVGGARLPEDALERVRAIFHRTREFRPVLSDSALRLKQQMADERFLLVMVFSILLRLAIHEGMVSRRDRSYLSDVFQIFMLTPGELDLIPDELQFHLECFLCASGFQADYHSRALSQHLEALECTADSSFEEVRSSYRRLVKKYHPDRIDTANADADWSRQQFEKVQTAYESISRLKDSG